MRSPSIESWMAPLDGVRAALLRAVGSALSRWLTDRERRANAGAVLAMIVALALTLRAPLWLLALGPVLLGAPHLASDLRYMVLRQGLHRRLDAWLLVGAPLALGALTPLGSRAFALSSLGAALVAKSRFVWRKTASIAVALSVCALFWRCPRASELAVGHAHNFIAVALWLAWRERARWGHWVVALLFLLINAALLSGLMDPVITALHAFDARPEGLTLGGQMRALAPLPEHIDFSRRAVLAFAFSQSVHYAMWLRAIPDMARASKTPRSFRQSVRGLEREAGPWLVTATALGCAALALWATVDLLRAREGYLRFVLFHGYLEIAVALWLFAEGRGLAAREVAS